MPPDDHQVTHADIAKSIAALSDLIKSGFPNGDPVEHRKVHDKYIQEAKDRHEFRQKVKAGFAQSFIWLVFLFVVAAIANYLGVSIKG